MCNLDGQWIPSGGRGQCTQKFRPREISFASGWFIVLVGGVGGGVCPGSYSCSRFVLCFRSCYHCVCVCFDCSSLLYVLLLFVFLVVLHFMFGTPY